MLRERSSEFWEKNEFLKKSDKTVMLKSLPVHSFLIQVFLTW